LNAGRRELLAIEMQQLRALPDQRLDSVKRLKVRVDSGSLVYVDRNAYSVNSRLIGEQVEARLSIDTVEIWYANRKVEQLPRLRGRGKHRIDYRHVIWSLVRKPGAFARYRYREELFPSLVFRRAYDALREARGERADVEYVRILHLAASTMQAHVEAVLEQLLGRGERPDFAAVKALAAPDKPTVPQVHIPPPDLAVYDRLLAGGES